MKQMSFLLLKKRFIGMHFAVNFLILLNVYQIQTNHIK